MVCSPKINEPKQSTFTWRSRPYCSNVGIAFVLAWCALVVPLPSQCLPDPIKLWSECPVCCPALFNSPEGIVSIGARTPLEHTLSFVTRCIFPTEEVVIVSDEFHGVKLNMQRYAKHAARRYCEYPENVPTAVLTTSGFLKRESGFFLQFRLGVPGATSKFYSRARCKRTNFIFTTGSHEVMLQLIAKVDEELKLLRSKKKIVWQPFIVFLWTEIQFSLRGSNFHRKLAPTPPDQVIVNSWLESYNHKFTLDSGVFFFFMVQQGNSTRSQKTLFLSVWEAMSLKGKSYVKRVRQTSNYHFEAKPSVISDKDVNGSCAFGYLKKSAQEQTNYYLMLERYKRRSNFNKMPLVASVLARDINSDFTLVDRNTTGQGVRLKSGFSVSLYKDFQWMLNFSEEVIIVETSPSNELVSSSTPLNSEVVDLSITQSSIYSARAEVVTFLQPTYYGVLEAFFQQPSANSIRNIVSAPFTMPLWITLISTWILILVCVHCGKYFGRTSCTKSYTEDACFIHEIGMWTIAATCQKSWHLSPRTLVFKAVFYIGSLMALVCYVAYSATIVSFLTVKTVPVRTFRDLISYGYEFAVHEDSLATKLLLKEMISTYRLQQKLVTTNTANEVTHIIDTKNTFLTYPDLFYQTAAHQNFTEKFLCATVYSVPAQNGAYKSSMFVKKGSQFQEILNEKMLIILERGLNYRYKNSYDNKRTVSCVKQSYDEGHTVVDPVRITDVFTAFLVIIVGWIIALWMFLSERLYHRRNLYFFVLTN